MTGLIKKPLVSTRNTAVSLQEVEPSLGNLASAFVAAQRGDHREAARLFQAELTQGGLKGSSKADVCRWIAECYRALEEYEEAGRWYEAAANAVLEDETSPLPLPTRAHYAAKDFEKAIDCYKSSGNLTLIKQASGQRYRLQHVGRS